MPSFRRDLAREIDIIEEVGRLHSYQAIPTALPHIRLEPVPRSPQRQATRQVLEYLLGCWVYAGHQLQLHAGGGSGPSTTPRR